MFYKVEWLGEKFPQWIFASMCYRAMKKMRNRAVIAVVKEGGFVVGFAKYFIYYC